MKVLTVFGTRPEIIRLSRIMPLLDEHAEHTTVHTGQNYDQSLSDVFLRDLNIRTPDYHLGVRAGGFGEQVAAILSGVDRILGERQPDRVLILGDTNSALASIVAARRGIPVFHLEAGNRCYDNRVPEETNRRLVDHSSTILLPYTERSKENLLCEGIERERIFVVGNPIYEVLTAYNEQIETSLILERLQVEPSEFCLVTLHRAENVDGKSRLERIIAGLKLVAAELNKILLVSLHPRTRGKLEQFNLDLENPRVRFFEPLGFFDFVKLEQNAALVLSDSGTVQEECAIFRIPNVTLRDVTERPETVECGSNVLSGADPKMILNAAKIAVAAAPGWTPPGEYVNPLVAQTVLKIVLGYSSIRRHV